jgi:hypothetical protein
LVVVLYFDSRFRGTAIGAIVPEPGRGHIHQEQYYSPTLHCGHDTDGSYIDGTFSQAHWGSHCNGRKFPPEACSRGSVRLDTSHHNRTNAPLPKSFVVLPLEQKNWTLNIILSERMNLVRKATKPSCSSSLHVRVRDWSLLIVSQ